MGGEMNPWAYFWGFITFSSIFSIGFLCGAAWASRDKIDDSLSPYDRELLAQRRREDFHVVDSL